MNRKKLQNKRHQRASRVRFGLKKKATSGVRVSVFRSLKQVYAQVIDDSTQKTVAMSSSVIIAKDNKDAQKLDKIAVAKLVGIDLAKKALAKNVDKACFDRGRYLYHGRVKSLAEGLREGGLGI